MLLKGRWDCGNKEGNKEAFLWFILNCCNLRENWATETAIYVHIQSPTRSPLRGFPGGSVVKSLPANVGDTGSVPDLGRSHMQLSPCSATREASLEKKPSSRNCGVARSLHNWRGPAQQQRPNTARNKKKKKKKLNCVVHNLHLNKSIKKIKWD